MSRTSVSLIVGAALTGLFLVAAPLSHAATDAEMVAAANNTIALYKKADPNIGSFFDRAAGYAVFPTVGKGGLGIGGAHGTGVVFEKGKPIGKVTLSQVTIGAQVGAQELSEVIFFETQQALFDFTKGKTAFSGQVSAVALKSGASANAKYQEGVAVFTATKGGLMAEASVGGQKFSYEPFVTFSTPQKK